MRVVEQLEEFKAKDGSYEVRIWLQYPSQYTRTELLQLVNLAIDQFEMQPKQIAEALAANPCFNAVQVKFLESAVVIYNNWP